MRVIKDLFFLFKIFNIFSFKFFIWGFFCIIFILRLLLEVGIVLGSSGEVVVIIILFGESNLWICLLWILLYIVNLFVFGYWFILLNISKIGLLVFFK